MANKSIYYLPGKARLKMPKQEGMCKNKFRQWVSAPIGRNKVDIRTYLSVLFTLTIEKHNTLICDF